MKRSGFHKLLLFALTCILVSCTEEYDFQIDDFDSLLVVEATITDELKFQELKLSKTFRLDSNEPNLVSNAQVWVETDNGVRNDFAQIEPGSYRSVEIFQAQPNQNYSLNVILSDGSQYRSLSEVLPATAELESIEPTLEVIEGVDGVQIYANSSSIEGDATYFRYDYEEAYKIVVPHYSDSYLYPINVEFTEFGPMYDLEIMLRTEDVSVCYTTFKSTEIVQTSLADSQNSSVVDFPIRFIASDSGILRERYTILVKQSVVSLEAYNFYRKLKELGTIENIFTDNQPGFIQGNIISVENADENVVGFFQVASVSSKRIYFNYSDLGIPFPPYLYECDVTDVLDYNDQDPNGGVVGEGGEEFDYRKIFNYLYSGDYVHLFGEFPEYVLVTAECGDCTRFSSTIRPEFWED